MPILEVLLAALPLAELAAKVIAVLWPKAPAWVGPLAGELVVVTRDLVEELTDDAYRDLSGRAKFEAVVAEVRDALDDGFDHVPEWHDLREAQRDRIIGGVAEFVLFVHRATERERRKADLGTLRRKRQPLLRLRRRVRPDLIKP